MRRSTRQPDVGGGVAAASCYSPGTNPPRTRFAERHVGTSCQALDPLSMEMVSPTSIHRGVQEPWVSADSGAPGSFT